MSLHDKGHRKKIKESLSSHDLRARKSKACKKLMRCSSRNSEVNYRGMIHATVHYAKDVILLDKITYEDCRNENNGVYQNSMNQLRIENSQLQ